MVSTLSSSTPPVALQLPTLAGAVDSDVDGPVRLTLEVFRRRSRFPRRPVAGLRYFIGSGGKCDLCLGGEDIPLIHSLIQTRGTHFWIEPIASQPPLLLNGEPTHGEWLREGDRIEIGSFQFVAHVATRGGHAADGGLYGQVPVAETLLDDAFEPDPAGMSAAELVELIEQEAAEVEEFAAGQQGGAAALLQSIRSRQSELGAELASLSSPIHDEQTLRFDMAQAGLVARARAEVSDSDLVQDLDRLCSELGTLTEQLERRSTALSQREASYSDAAAQLLDAQGELMRQLETVAQQVTRLKVSEQEPTPPSRAIA